MEPTEHTKYTRTMLFILAIVLLVASIIGYFVSQNISNKGGAATNYQQPTAIPPTPTLIPYPVQGSFVLKVQGGNTAESGKPFVLDLFATSSKDTVAGYDVVLSYDTAAFENQSIQNKMDSFRIFTFKRSGHLSISGTKNLSVSDEIHFSNTPLLSFTFLPKQKGTYTFSLKAVGSETSKLVNEAAAVTYPEAVDFRLEIK